MNRICFPRVFEGRFCAPPSKSEAHRLLIAAALAENPSHMIIESLSEDILATVSCLTVLGAKIDRTDGGLSIEPISEVPACPQLDAGESGTTVRFLLPVAAALTEHFSATGRGRLPQRPLGPLFSAMREHGFVFSKEALPLEALGALTGGTYRLPGNVSSQFISGCLFALTRLGGAVELTAQLESRPYVDMTVDTLRRFGAIVRDTENGWAVEKTTLKAPECIRPGGDFSNAAFFLAAAAIGGCAEVMGLSEDSLQGDRRILDALGRFGAKIERTSEGWRVKKAPLTGTTVDVSDIPDLLPVLSVVGACAEGKTEFIRAARLRQKESDRIRTTCDMLNNLGIRTEQTEDSMTVFGGCITSGTVDAAGDHRIAMSAAVASTVADGAVTVLGAEAVNKSFPDFFERFFPKEAQ